MTTRPGKLLVVGDFNIHVDDNTDKRAEAFVNVTSDANLRQHVEEATHDHGHILDLVFTRKGELNI